MITMKTKVNVKGVSGKTIFDFMLNCTDEYYQQWWEGVHLSFYTIKRYPDNIGNLVFFDEFIGHYRLKFAATVTEAIPNKKIVWQMTKGLKLPGWLTLVFEDSPDGVEIIHSIKLGFNGLGRILDPLLKVYFSSAFEKELNEHARIEFHKLAQLLA